MKDLTLEECVRNINDPNYTLIVKTTNIIYKIKLNRNENDIERQEKLIIFGNSDRLELLKNKEYKEFFIDVTFKIIPRKYRPYKLMTMATLDYKKNKTYLICFVLLKFLDQISYCKIFQYLHENFDFNPCIIHTDFENSLAIAIRESKFFNNEIIHVRCFFHFIKAIREKLHKLGLYNKKLNKETFTIIKNIELICFLDIDKVDKFKSFIIETINTKPKYKKFINYLNNYWFKKNNRIYNYSEFFSKYKNDNLALNKIYLTNNIVESIHGKLNYYLPKHIANNQNFINSLNNIFINDTI